MAIKELYIITCTTNMSGVEIVNAYDYLPEEYRTGDGCQYKNYKNLKIPLYSRIMIVGCSGSGKTSLVVQFPKFFSCHDRIYLFAKNLREPLYAYMIDWFAKLSKKYGQQILFYTEDENEIPDVDDFDPKFSNLIIMDDLIACNLKTKRKIADIWIRSRKQNCTCLFLTQNYTTVAPVIRRNTDIIILKKISTKRDLKFIISEYNLGLDPAALLKLYEDCKGMTSFLLIDTNAPEEDRFRCGFKVIHLNKLLKAERSKRRSF